MLFPGQLWKLKMLPPKYNLFSRYFQKVLRFTGYKLLGISDRFDNFPVKVMTQDDDWVLCETGNIKWKLNKKEYIDREIINKGVFELQLTHLVHQYVKPGMVVLDVGANIGYYTIQFSKLVEGEGRVFAFEPSSHYLDRLSINIELNKCRNVVVCPFGLSDDDGTGVLLGDDISSTMHWTSNDITQTKTENISLRTLDGYLIEEKLGRLDIIKVDIDGHEPFFINGAFKTISRFHPLIFMEFSQLNLVMAGSSVEHLASQFEKLGYKLGSEKHNRPYLNYLEFLIDTMNCTHSVNVICYPPT